MNSFFTKYDSTLGVLHDIFKQNKVQDETFYILGMDEIKQILKDHSRLLIDFISKYNFEKGCLNNIAKDASSIEFMEVDDYKDGEEENKEKECSNPNDSTANLYQQEFDASSKTIQLNVADEIQEFHEIINSSVEHTNLPTALSDSSDLMSIDLYCLLMSRPDGVVLLRRYKFTKIVDYHKLKDIVIYHEIEKDPITRRIKKEVFNKYRKEFALVFPTEDPDYFYVEHQHEDNQIVGAHGCIYNHYKSVRKLYREARLMNDSHVEESKAGNNSGVQTEEIDSGLKSITDQDRRRYTKAQIISDWARSFEKRFEQLEKEKKSLEVYLNSFPALCYPDAIILLEQDFTTLLTQRITEKEVVRTIDAVDYNNLLCDKWPHSAKKIVEFAKKHLRGKEVKQFLSENAELISEGTCTDLIALFLLPLSIKFTKSIKVKSNGEGKTVVLDKFTKTECFILHVEAEEKVDEKKKKRTEFLRSLDQPIHPYLLFVGKLENVKAYVVIKDEHYPFRNPIEAVDRCWKCLYALNSLPATTNFIWKFFEKEIYFPECKVTSVLAKYISDMKKFYSGNSSPSLMKASNINDSCNSVED